MDNIDIHADDYALTPNTSRDMLACMEKGLLDSISIVPNMSCFEECMELLYQKIPELPFLPKMSVHLDFVEGRCLAGKEKAPVLVGREETVMGLSWGKLFLLSYMPWKKRTVKTQLKLEIREQLKEVNAVIDRAVETAKEAGVPNRQRGMRIDSHQHAHMIPIVWDALTEVIEEEGYAVEYIRNSREILWKFVIRIDLWKTYRAVNFVKNRLLALYSHKVERYTRINDREQMYLWGLIMSGHMDYDRIKTLYPAIAAKARKDGRTLEILFHPGLTLPEEVTEEIGRSAAADFYLRPDRHVEMEALGRIRELIRQFGSI